MNRRNAFSLLEVILALAILTGAMAVLGELARLGMRNAAWTRDITQAQLLCESKMAEITSGIVVPEPTAIASFVQEDLVDPYSAVTWVYSIDLEEVQEPGVVAVRVTVTQDLPPAMHPAAFSLVRWIVAPDVSEESVINEDDSSADTSGKGSTTSTKSATSATGASSTSQTDNSGGGSK
jgi:general secretion pathway protein I